MVLRLFQCWSQTILQAISCADTNRHLRIATVILSYWLISIAAIFTNKSLLSGKTKAPFFIAWFQCLIAIVGCYICLLAQTKSDLSLKKSDPSLKKSDPSLKKSDLSLNKCTEILPLSFMFVAMIALNNLFLASVGVSFYYIGRSLSTVFSVILSYLILGQKTSFLAMSCCGVVTVGFFLGVDQEGQEGVVTAREFVVGVLSSLFASLNAVYTSKYLPSVNGDIWELNFYNNVNASLLFIPLIVFNFELQSIFSSEVVLTLTFWVEMVIAGIFGLAVGYATGLQISETSALTHNISGISKSAVQTVLATQVNREGKSCYWWVSNGVVLAGSLAYAWVKSVAMNKERKVSKEEAI